MICSEKNVNSDMIWPILKSGAYPGISPGEGVSVSKKHIERET